MDNYYNKISKGYNGLYKEEQLKKLSIVKDNIELNKHDALLDVGCGTGLSSEFGCEVVGVDTSFKLLKLNKNKNKILSNAEDLPFKDNIFDIVVSITALHNFGDIAGSLKEMKRVGKGKFVFSLLKMSKKFNEIEELIEKYFKIGKIVEENKDMIFFVNDKLKNN